MDDLPEVRPANPAEFASYRVQLADGRWVWLSALRQTHTYSGLLSGYPNRFINLGVIERALDCAPDLMRVQHPAVLLSAKTTPYAYPGAASGEHPCEALPPVQSITVFDSAATTGGTGDHSAMLLLWFQPEWGLPPEDVLACLRALDWEAQAHDWSW